MEEESGVLVLATAVVVGEEEQIFELQQEILPQGWSSQEVEVVHSVRAIRMAAMEDIRLVDPDLLVVTLEQEGDLNHPEELEL